MKKGTMKAQANIPFVVLLILVGALSFLFFLSIGKFGFESISGQAVLTLQPGSADGEDTLLASGSPNTNFATATNLEPADCCGGLFGHGLLRFNLSSIPSGSTITSMILNLTGSVVTGSVIEVYRLLPANRNWTENEATWNKQNNALGISWAGSAGASTAGTDYSSAVMGNFTLTGSDTTHSMVLDLTEAQAMFVNNAGMLILTTTLGTDNLVYSSDTGTAAFRPKLIVTYTILETAPVVSTIILNSTFGTNRTEENLTVYFTSSDSDGDPVINITDWRINGTSIAVLNMPFENHSNSANNATDYSTFRNNGSVVGATFNATGGFNGKGAYRFDGADDFIKIEDTSDFDFKDFTYTAWINVGLTIGDKTIIDVDDNEQHLSIADGSIFTQGRTCEAFAGLPGAGTPQWRHIAWTVSGSGYKLYHNGIVLDSASAGCSASVDGDRLVIGAGLATGGSSNDFFNGTIDEVRVYNRSLSTEEIRALYLNRADLIVSQETEVGDIWSVAVTPNDGKTDGTTVLSNNLTVISCINPTNSMNVTSDTTFCPGTFNLANGIIINASNIAVTCDQTILVGAGNTGFFVTGFNNVTINGCMLKSYNFGMYLLSSSNNTIFNNNFTNNGDTGIRIETSSDNRLFNNTFTGSNRGIFLTSAANRNIITNNTATANNQGIFILSTSNDNNISNNIFSNNFDNGIILIGDSKRNIISNNMISSNTNDGIGLVTTSNDNNLSNNNISNSPFGILITTSFNNLLSNNTFVNNTADIQTTESSTTNTLLLLQQQNQLSFVNKFINVTDIDNLFINTSIVAVNVSAEPAMNVSANVSFIVPSCNVSLFKTSAFHKTIEDARASATSCTTCSSFICANNIANFTTSHFSTIFASFIPVITTIYPNATNQTQAIASTINNVSLIIKSGTNVTFNVTVEDLDSDSLTFSWFIDSIVNATNIISSANANFSDIFSFTPNAAQHNITVVVNDSLVNDTFTFIIVPFAPIITTIFPNATNQTQLIVTNDTNVSLTVTEGQNITFNISALDEDSSALTFRWFVDGVLVVVNTITISVNNLFTDIFSFLFNQTGLHNITVVVNDSASNDTFTFAVNVSCRDADGDGYNGTTTGCGTVDCSDNAASIRPPKDNEQISSSVMYCPGTFTLASGLDVVANNVVVTCNATTLLGTGSNNGFTIVSQHNDTIQHCVINNYTKGILVSTSENTTIYNNSISSASGTDIELTSCSHSNLSNNIANILLFDSSDIILSNTVASNSTTGISLSGSSNNELSENTAMNNTIGIFLFDSQNNSISNDVLTNNSQFGASFFISSSNTVFNGTLENNTLADIFSFDSGSSNTLVVLEDENQVKYSNKFINVSDIDNVFINTSIVAVNSVAETNINTSATVSFAVQSCDFVLATSLGFTRNISEALSSASLCTTCSNITCVNSVMNFSTSSFSTIIAVNASLLPAAPAPAPVVPPVTARAAAALPFAPCVADFTCSEWSACVNETQKRICIDARSCAKPKIEIQGCEVPPVVEIPAPVVERIIERPVVVIEKEKLFLNKTFLTIFGLFILTVLVSLAVVLLMSRRIVQLERGDQFYVVRDLIDAAQRELHVDRTTAVQLYNDALIAYQSLPEEKKELLEPEIKELQKQFLPVSYDVKFTQELIAKAEAAIPSNKERAQILYKNALYAYRILTPDKQKALEKSMQRLRELLQ